MKSFKTIIALAFFSLTAVTYAAPPTTVTSHSQTNQDIQKTFGMVPTFMKSVPESALPAAWEEMKTVQLSTSTVVPPRMKELIGLAIAAQIPCHYCVYFHTEAAKANGASDEEIKEAISLAGSTQHWSTFLNGIQYKEADYMKEVDQMVAYSQKQMANASKTAVGEAKPQPISDTSPNISTDEDVVSQAQAATVRPTIATDAKSAYEDMEKTVGSVPGFVKQFPDDGVASAWNMMKAVEYNPNSQLTAKEKELIGLAVAAQIPCKYCTYSHTEGAKVNGASAQEINETLAMASVTRYWSTVLNGSQVDEKTFKREVDQMLRFVKTQKNKKVGMTAVTKR